MLLISLVAIDAAAENFVIEPERQFQFADRLYQEGQYRRAAEEYERFAYFFPEHPRQREAVFKSGEAFLRAGEADAALRQFQSISDGARTDHLSVEARFLTARAYLLSGQPNQAVNQLYTLITGSDSQEIKDRAYLSIAWIAIDQLEWETAGKVLTHISQSGRKRYQVDRLAAELATAGQVPHKSPVTAGTLSVLPGAGQLYCGRYQDAAAAFIVNGALFWAAYESFDNDLNALGGILLITGFGFYAGNIYGAVSSAHKYNQKQKHDFSDHLKQHVIIGLRPKHNSQSHASAQAVIVQLTFDF